MNSRSPNLASNRPPSAATGLGRRASWIWIAGVSVPLGVLIAIAASLIWPIHGGNSLDLGQQLAYSAFLIVAASAPIAMPLLIKRLAAPVQTLSAGPPPRWLSSVAGGVALSVGIVTLGLVTYRLGHDFAAKSAEHRLHAVATLKSSLVTSWLADVRDDLRLWLESPNFVKALTDWRRAGGEKSGARDALLDSLGRLSKTFHYIEIGLRDPRTGELLLTTTGDEDSPAVRRQAIEAATASVPIIEDFHRDSEGENAGTPYLGFFAATMPSDGSEPVVVHVGIDPRRDFFPLIEQWPGVTGTAEVLLMRREGDSILVLNDARPRGDALAQERRVSTSSVRYIGHALAKGQVGSIRGRDDLNQPVIAYAVAVPGTSWFVLAKVDETEAFAELNRIALLTAAITGALALMGAWWWVERHRHRLVELQRQIERTEQSERLAELSRRLVLAQEDERRHWSSELHDRTGANLAAINLNLKAIGKRMRGSGPEDDELMKETSELLSDTVVSIREFCGTLRPAVLDYAGLVPALETLVQQFERRTGVTVRFDHAGFAGRCSGELESALFRIAQEALVNCTKHAQAGEVVVTLTGAPARLSLTIIDDGVGFDPAGVGRHGGSVGQGLLNMRERAAFIGAQLTIESAPGHGTRVVAALTSLARQTAVSETPLK